MKARVSVLLEAMECGEKGGCGHNSTTYRYNGTMHKTVFGKRKLGKNEYQMTEGRANEIKSWLDIYINLQKKYGIPIPETKVSVISIDGKYGIWLEQEAVGPDLASIIKKEKDADYMLHLCQQIRDCFIAPVEKGTRKRQYSDLGLDLKTENFCLSKSGNLLLVDLFPPHIWVGENGTRRAVTEMFPVPKRAYETKLFLLFTGEGMRLNALAQLGRLRPDLFETFKKGLGCERLMENIVSQIPSMKFEGLEDAYRARAAVCEFACRNGIGSEVVNKFFELTHVEDDSLSREKVLHEIDRFRAREAA